jgi:hypothetical protein
MKSTVNKRVRAPLSKYRKIRVNRRVKAQLSNVGKES